MGGTANVTCTNATMHDFNSLSSHLLPSQDTNMQAKEDQEVHIMSKSTKDTSKDNLEWIEVEAITTDIDICHHTHHISPKLDQAYEDVFISSLSCFIFDHLQYIDIFYPEEE